jgi:hypothetical protein
LSVDCGGDYASGVTGSFSAWEEAFEGDVVVVVLVSGDADGGGGARFDAYELGFVGYEAFSCAFEGLEAFLEGCFDYAGEPFV